MLSERDVLMYDSLKKRGVALHKRSSHCYLVTKSEKAESKEAEFEEILILDDTVEDFSNEPIISIGSTEIECDDQNNISIRERILLNPQSSTLNAKAAELCTEVKKVLVEKKSATKDDFALQQFIIDAAMIFTRQLFLVDKESEEKIEKLANTSKIKHGLIPVLEADKCLIARIGVCRHVNLIFAFFVDYLKKVGILAPGNIFYQRDVLEGISHAFILYRPENVFFDAILADPLLCKKSYRLIEDRKAIPKMHHDFKARKNCLIRCGLITEPYPGYCYSEFDLTNRAKYLFAARYAEKRQILNYEYVTGNLDTLEKELKNPKYGHRAGECLEVIEIIKTSDKLLATRYSQIKDSDSQDQFIFALLLKGTAERNIILANQNKDDLISLKKNFDQHTQLFGVYANCNLLLEAVINAIAARAKETPALFRPAEDKKKDDITPPAATPPSPALRPVGSEEAAA